MSNKTKSWIKAAAIRAIKTMAQTFVGCLPTTTAILGDVNWGVALSSAALAGILSICTSLGGLPEVEDMYGE